MLGSSCLDPVKWQRPGGRVMVARQQVWQDLNEDYLIELSKNFPPPSFFQQGRGKSGTIFLELFILIILSPLLHILLVFFNKEGRKMKKNVFSFTFFSPNHIFLKIFYLPSPSNLKIYTPVQWLLTSLSIRKNK